MSGKARHGHARRGHVSALWLAWRNMRTRCTDPNYKGFHNYGGRGITVCIRWDAFENFAADMGPHPGKGWTLERKRSNENYCKANCKWATQATQQRNRRNNKLTLKAVQSIRSAYVSGNRWHPGNTAFLAAKFAVSRHTVYEAATGRTWL